jgi:hypothetical protein
MCENTHYADLYWSAAFFIGSKIAGALLYKLSHLSCIVHLASSFSMFISQCHVQICMKFRNERMYRLKMPIEFRSKYNNLWVLHIAGQMTLSSLASIVRALLHKNVYHGATCALTALSRYAFISHMCQEAPNEGILM